MRENYNPIKSTHQLLPKQTRNTSIERKEQPNALLLKSSRLGDQFKKFILPKENIMQAVSIVEWRCQTSLPIIRVAEYVVSPENHPSYQKPTFRSETPNKNNANNPAKKNKLSIKINEFIEKNQDISTYEIKVRPEEIKCRLSEVGVMPFSQALYLLKEMLIGFEALFDIFGGFEAKQDLIAVNCMDQWCMWIDEDYCNNLKTQSKINEKEFIYKLVLLTEKHSLQTIQSRNFFGGAKSSTYANDCSFIKMFQKLKDFINFNRIYIPSKVTIVKETVKLEGETLQNAKNNLRKIVSPSLPKREALFRKRKESCQTFYAYNQSGVSSPKQFPMNGNHLASYPSCAELRRGFAQRNFIVPPLTPSSHVIGGDKNVSFHGICDNWGEQNNQDSFVSLKALHSSPRKKQEECEFQRSGQKEQPGLSFSRASPSNAHSSPVFFLSRPRHLKKPEVEALPSKPVSQLHEPVKRANIRKYSQQLIKLKSADNLLGKKFQSSTICNNLLEQQQKQLHLQEEKPQPPKKEIASPSESSQGIILSSPNNSSSTKEIGNSGEMQHDERKPTYRSMKMKDLAPHRKNNQSLINCNFHDTTNKNMTVSYQFKSGEAQSDSQSEDHTKKPKQHQWVNKISDLFSDTMSIKQLKGSIKFKTKEEEIFEKDYLKDVKLEMLQKFGRSVTLHCDQDNDFVQQPRVVSKQNQYKSMQLIEEQLEQVKSYQEDERRDDDLTSKSIRSIRSRRQTQGYMDKQRQISFKDDFIYFEEGEKGESIFNFETEMYNIRARRPT